MIRDLRRVIVAKDERIALLEAENTSLREDNAQLRTRVADLEQQLKMNSRNSSLPPSSDQMGRAKPKSLREKTGRKPGKAAGEGGSALAMTVPDVEHDWYPRACRGCGAGLAGAAEAGLVRRQVHELPEPAIVVTEHRMHKRRCACGCVTVAASPAGVDAPVSYGPALRAFAVYLVVFQLLPVARTAELISDLTGATVSEGWIMNVLAEAHDGLADVDAAIKTLITLSYVVHADETSMKLSPLGVSGGKGWLHVAATTTLTSYHVHLSRGLKAVREHGVLPAFAGVLVHDGLSMYDSARLADPAGERPPVFTHALCGAHLARELVAAAERHPGRNWPLQAKRALYALNDAAHEARGQGRDHIPPEILGEQVTLFRHAVRIGLAAHRRDHTRREQSKTRNLLERLRDREADVLRYARDLAVPFTNNRAEGDLRMAKTKVKVSGAMRTLAGLKQFARIRGYLSSARKNGVTAWNAGSSKLSGVEVSAALAGSGAAGA
nr:IS66 family transposase [Planomonospora venezuelensis]